MAPQIILTCRMLPSDTPNNIIDHVDPLCQVKCSMHEILTKMQKCDLNGNA